MMSKSIIVAHYNENLDWLYDIDKEIKIYLYTKSNTIPNINSDNIIVEQLENIGNEGQTYFYHIVKYYSELTDFIYFTQADYTEHSHNFIEKINNNYVGGLSDINLITTVYGNVDSSIYHKHINHKYSNNFTYKDVDNKIFIDPWNDKEAADNINFVIDNLPELKFEKTNWVFNANGMYAVTKERLRQFDFNFYNKCEQMFKNKPEELKMIGFAFERINQMIFL